MELIGAGMVLVWMVVAVLVAIAWIHGLVLAFRAHVVLGVICLFIEPAYIVFALVMWVSGKDLAGDIVAYFSRLSDG